MVVYEWGSTEGAMDRQSCKVSRLAPFDFCPSSTAKTSPLPMADDTLKEPCTCHNIMIRLVAMCLSASLESQPNHRIFLWL